MAIKVQGQTVVDDDRKGSFQVSNPGRFTTAERDALTPEVGDIIYNTDEPALQIWDGTEWGSAGGSAEDLTLPPVINNVTLSEVDVKNERFTDQEFNVVIDMVQDGTPASNKGLKGKVTAEFKTFPQTDDSTNIELTSEANNLWDNRGTVNVPDEKTVIFQYYDNSSVNAFRYFVFQGNSSGSELYEINSKSAAVSYFPKNVGSTYAKDDYTQAYDAGDGKNVVLSANTFDCVTLDMEEFIRTGSYAPGYRGSTATTEKWTYTCSGNNGLYVNRRSRITGNQEGNVQTSPTSIQVGYIAAVDNNTLAIVGRSSSGGGQPPRVILIKDDVSDDYWNSTNKGVQYTMGSSIPICMFAYQGKLYSTDDNTLHSLSADGVQSSVPLPAVGQDGGYHVVSVDHLTNTFYSVSYDGTTRTFKSTNYGVTWTPLGSQYNESSPNTPYNSACAFTPQGPMFKYQPDNDSSRDIVQLAGYYQEVTVADNNSIDAIQLDAFVVPSSYTGPDGWGTGQVLSITDGAAGTKKVRIEGGALYEVGDSILATATNGIATTTRFLVLDATGAVSTTQAVDPGFTSVGSGSTKTITFPSTFPTGNTPDEEFAEGTIFQVDVQAENSNTATTYPSNSIVPGSNNIPDDLTLNLTSRTFAAGVGVDIQWYSDAGGVLTSISDADADATWKSQQYWINESGGSLSNPKGFQGGSSSNGIGGSEKAFTLNFDCIGLKNKLVNFKLVGRSSTNGEVNARIESSTTGAEPYLEGYGGQMGYYQWNSVSSNETINEDMALIISEDISTLEVTFKFSGPGPQDHFLAIPWYRVTDLDGNELPFYPAVTQD